MTIEEYNALDECEKKLLKEDFERCRMHWQNDKQIVDLPYPENFIRFAYRNDGKIMLRDGYEDAAEEMINHLSPNNRDFVHMIFKERKGLTDVADMFGIIDFTVYNRLCKAVGLCRHPARSRCVKNFIYFEN